MTDDFDNILTLSQQDVSNTKKIAELNQLLEVRAVEKSFAVCDAQNVLAELVNPSLPSSSWIPIVGCKVTHCNDFNLLATQYNTEHNEDILSGSVATHALADCS